MDARDRFGIDIGGSGIKGAPVDLETGEFAADRLRIADARRPSTPTPSPRWSRRSSTSSTTRASDGRSASPFPAVIQPGVAHRGQHRQVVDRHRRRDACRRKRSGAPCAWSTTRTPPASPRAVRRGQGARRPGLHGHAGHRHRHRAAVDGVLVPNTELGHLEIDGHDAETARPTASGTGRTSPGSSGRSGCSGTSGGREPALARPHRGRRRREQERATSSCRCSTSARRSCPPSCATPPASSAPPCSRASGAWRRASEVPSGGQAAAGASQRTPPDQLSK